MSKKIKVLVIGSGGREYALVKKIRKSPMAGELFCLPGSDGIGRIAKCVKIDPVKNMPAVVAFAKKNKIGLVVIGPEVPLVAGLADELRAAGILVFGPSQEAAQLEGSKAFMKQLLAKYDIPTAPFRIFQYADQAMDYVGQTDRKFPLVIKTSGLAAGKGAIICQHLTAAQITIVEMMKEGKFGDAGKTIIIEEFLPGEEVSFMVMVDGENILPLATSQDHKRLRDGDQGPNTGGMGAYSPAPIVTPALQEKIIDKIIKPTVQAMKNEGMPFRGLLYAGLMIKGNDVWVLEYNVRFGDPETQPVLMRMKSDILPPLLAAANGSLAGMEIEWDPRPTVCVAMVSKEYPEKPVTGFKIEGLQEAGKLSGVEIQHGATKFKPTLGVFTNGGRVIYVTANSGKGESFSAAKTRAYQAVGCISWEGEYHRSDIGDKAINR